MTRLDPDFLQAIRNEFSSTRHWIDRAIVLAYATAAGLAVVGFTILSEWAFGGFHALQSISPWLALIWTPALTAAIVWTTRRWFSGAGGSGIPQVMAALDPVMPPEGGSRFVSLRLSLGKIGLSSAGLLAGLSLGREGPSVQVAAGVMQHAQRWLGPRSGIDRRALLVAGGAAGIAAAFNAPLAGVVFAIEELSRKLESRSSGLILAAIVLAGLMGVSVFGNLTYFGRIAVPRLGWDALLPGLAVALLCGLLGGLFSRLLIASMTGGSAERLTRWRARRPVAFAAACGLLIAVIGLASGGDTFGAGSETVKLMLAGQAEVPPLYVLLKFAATWLTSWSGVPAGIFAPSLSIGAGVGHDVARIAGGDIGPALIAMGMAAFLAAVTQAPLTAFIIVMEMVDGHAMVLSLMTAAMIASLVSRMVSRSLYATLAEAMVDSVIGQRHPEAVSHKRPDEG
ncbi:chloride channel protein [Hydrogenophaga sp. BPS33]|uniref:chloride channel protein n=1 Tax=Hydrogenophaga sp. BPS33 TaxID=2651974 RepID=UPI00131F7604|nr:chloride channel protein [Hydrogenophaga sp. BPS33]QHE87043.1 chloride channel protein [Hydrogenophaga sp. BPS33]